MDADDRYVRSQALRDSLRSYITSRLTGDYVFDDAVVWALFQIRNYENKEWSQERRRATAEVRLASRSLIAEKDDVQDEEGNPSGRMLALGRDPEVYGLAYEIDRVLTELERTSYAGEPFCQNGAEDSIEAELSVDRLSDGVPPVAEDRGRWFPGTESTSRLSSSLFEERDELEQAKKRLIARSGNEKDYDPELFYSALACLTELMTSEYPFNQSLVSILHRIKEKNRADWSAERKRATGVHSTSLAVNKASEAGPLDPVPFPDDWEEVEKLEAFDAAIEADRRLTELEQQVYSTRPFPIEGSYAYSQLQDRFSDLYQKACKELESHFTGDINADMAFLWNEYISYEHGSRNSYDPIWEAIYDTNSEMLRRQSEQEEQEGAQRDERYEHERLRYEEERRNDIDLEKALRSFEEEDEHPGWIWCLVGNIVDEHLYGPDKVVREGTKHFRPGAKVYCLDAYWGSGGERVIVMGLPRKKRHLIKTVLDCRLIHNFRLQKVFDKRIIRTNGYTWSNTNEAQILIKRLAARYNGIAKEQQDRIDAHLREKAFQIARSAHAGQVDKAGRPYIDHPLAVERLVKTPKQRIVALLHDVVEDTPVTLDDLKPFGKKIVRAIDAISKRQGEPLDEYLIRVEANPLARAVKIADLTHNSDLTRIPNPTPEDIERVLRYEAEIVQLKKRKD
jgi:hypothetical protein